MLASINWLKQYVDITLSPEDLAEKLTRAGLEVEQVIHLGKGLEGVITGKVAQIERHPNSDHLWVCQMDLGQGELVQILTGAQNVKQGNLVPVAVVGSTLPKGMTLKKAKMRGLDSNGMLCSAEELGIDAKLLLPEQREGIFILPDTTPIGVDVKDLLGLNDVVLDIDLTANRGDCFNMLGLAGKLGTHQGTRAAARTVHLGRCRRQRGRPGQGFHRMPGPVLPVCPAYGKEHQGYRISGMDAEGAAGCGHPSHQQCGGRDQLRDDGTGPAHACL